MNYQKACISITALTMCSANASSAPTPYSLGATTHTQGSGVSYTPSGLDVEWASIGKLSWEPFSGNSKWQQANAGSISWPSSLTDSGTGFHPDKQPHGDVLAYTMGGVGDVDGDGYGDFAITWYDAEIRDEPTAVPSGPPGYFSSLPAGADRVGYVRVISGNPVFDDTFGGSGSWGNQFDFDTYNVNQQIFESGRPKGSLRRIGADFWGKVHWGLWSHEMTSIGDLDGDGRSEVILSANSGGTGGGYLEIWSWSDNYFPHGAVASGPRWVKLIEIDGVNDTSPPPVANLNEMTRIDEFGYQAYSGSIPESRSGGGYTPTPVGFNLDFNNDGQPDLITASRFHRDDAYGHYVRGDASGDRSSAPGAVWVFLMPNKDVFEHIQGYADQTCDEINNWTGETGSDDITDDLPLRMTSEDFSIKILGDQLLRTNTTTGPSTGSSRWFGEQIDPAGDLDGDGILDLAVAAPYHVAQDRYVQGVSSPDYEGQVYFFLSSSFRDESDDPRWGDSMSPKFYMDYGDGSPLHFIPVRQECGGDRFAYRIKSDGLDTLGQQVVLKSSDADYVLIGDQITSVSTGLGGSMEAGVNLDGDLDPDMVLGDNKSGQVFVFLDLQASITNDMLGITAPLSTPRVLWRYNGVSNIIESDIIISSGSALPGENGVHFNLRDANPSKPYPGPGNISLAGDYDGDGDCEIFIPCTSALSNRVLLVVDIPDVPATVGASNVLAEIWPETINFTANAANDFNEIDIHHANLEGWALWNDRALQTHDDMLVGARGFPRLIEEFPHGSSMYPVGLFDQNDTADTDWLAVPAGKGYLLRVKQP